MRLSLTGWTKQVSEQCDFDKRQTLEGPPFGRSVRTSCLVTGGLRRHGCRSRRCLGRSLDITDGVKRSCGISPVQARGWRRAASETNRGPEYSLRTYSSTAPVFQRPPEAHHSGKGETVGRPLGSVPFYSSRTQDEWRDHRDRRIMQM